MKTKLFKIIIVAFVIGVVACNSSQKPNTNKSITVGDNSMVSLDWNGTYQGILPCADCVGIRTQLTLNNDLTFVLMTQYSGKNDSVFKEVGKFVWNENGSSITLDNKNKQAYQVGENILFHLDKSGKRITGDLSDRYILEKEKAEISGKYWKLVRLNGHKIVPGKREPFIQFATENSLVGGNNGCNNFSGSFELTDTNRIKFSKIMTTKMACVGINTEEQFMIVLENTTSFALTANELILQDENETSLAKFEADFFK